jgi:hypothetical protein
VFNGKENFGVLGLHGRMNWIKFGLEEVVGGRGLD